jgi:hypothetical protein
MLIKRKIKVTQSHWWVAVRKKKKTSAVHPLVEQHYFID